jgi:hypothetical protein
MKRRATLGVLALTLVAACGGTGSTATVKPSGAPASGAPAQTSATQPSAAATSAAQPSAAPVQPGAGTATVVLVGGPDAGTYTGNENPNCSQGIIGPGGWGTQYSTTSVDDKGLGSIQIVSAAPGKENDPDAFMSGVTLLTTVTIGPSLGENSRDYEIRVSDDDKATGTGSAQIVDHGTTAVIHVTGMTGDGVSMDVTVTCPSVTRV